MSKIYSYAIFVDLPNFYSHLLRSDLEDPRLLRDYFINWLDFDRLSKNLAGVVSPTWVFYSGQRLGPSANRIDNEYLNKYINRINNTRGVTAKDVNIPNTQREPASFTCKCGEKGTLNFESEKGIDSSLTVHLFDTMDTWDIAYLLSGDADFVPAVSSLRRRGKIVIGAGFPKVSSALVRECYDYIYLNKSFLHTDIFAYKLFKKEGFMHKWFTAPIDSGGDNVKISLSWRTNEEPSQRENVNVGLRIDKNIDLTSREELLQGLTERHSDYFRGFTQRSQGVHVDLRIPFSVWGKIRKSYFMTSTSDLGANVHDQDYYGDLYMRYARKTESDDFEVILDK